jgi:predicted alpha/beta hydrolase
MSNSQTPPIHELDIRIHATDDYPLQATQFESVDGVDPASPITIIGAGVAVPRGYYRSFARYLAQHGRTVLTFDYRGIGGSLQGSVHTVSAHLRDWGQKDIAGVIAHAARTWPGRPIHWVGHSHGGGFGIGLAPNNHLIDRLLGIAVPFGYWGDMAGLERYRVALLMHVAIPVLAGVFGFIPGKGTGLGEDLPKDVALEWKSWICSRNSMWDTLPLSALQSYENMRAPLCFIRFCDDPWASAHSVERIRAAFTHADSQAVVCLGPGDVGNQRIGHMGFFRSRFAATLWPKALHWLEAPA